MYTMIDTLFYITIIIVFIVFGTVNYIMLWYIENKMG